MNPFAISFLLIIISTWSMASLLFLKSEGRKTVIMWGWLCIAVSIWGIGGLIGTTTLSETISFIGWKIANIGTIIIPVVFFKFVDTYFELNKRSFLASLYVMAGFFLIINFFAQHLFFGNIKFIFNEFYYLDWTTNKGPIYLILYIEFYWMLLFYSFFFLFKNLILSEGIKRNEIKYLVVSSGIGWIGAHGNFLSVFRNDIYPYSNFLIAIFPLITGYAIIRHQLLDIQVVIKRSLVYSILVALLTLIYIVLVFLVEQMFRGSLGYRSPLTSLFIVLILAIIAAPLKNRIQDIIDRLFLRGTPLEIATEISFLRQEVKETDRLKSVATLASGMAHEIKNPLTAIKTFSEFLPKKLEDKEFLLRFSQIVGSEVDRIDHLVNQLLEFARPSPPKFIDTNIVKLVNDVLEFLNSEFIKHKVHVIKNFNHQPIIVRIDPKQFKQAILNVILNAIQAMTPDGGALTVDIQPILNEGKNLCCLSFRDTGQGIAFADLPRIFDPFYTTKDRGTGLGLSITHGIIENHGGLIFVESSAGKGTNVVIELPMKKSG